MKISEETFENFNIQYELDKLAPMDRVLFLDIETTGFSASSSYIYLIGCSYYQAGKWHSIQWLAENYQEEVNIITAFFDFASLYRFLFHFNGNNFDLPFIAQKCLQYSLPYSLEGFQGIDLYKRISPYKYFLKLPNCKQKTLEQFLGIDREDTFTGGELIGVYRDYVKSPTNFAENLLFLHNAEDLKGMLSILPILAYYDLFHEAIKAKKVQSNTYTDMDGQRKKELIISAMLTTPLPKLISSSANNCYFRGFGLEGTIKVPIYEEELKFFYSNYKDYYYLPNEDVALHKSVATFVDRDYRIPATAATCYTRKFSEYLPQYELLFEPFFKRDYKSKELFFELTQEQKKDRQSFHIYASHILNMISTAY